MKVNILWAVSFCLLTVAWLQPARAASTDPNAQQPYEIHADNAVFDQKQGTGIYTGHVQLKRGTEELNATRMMLKLNNDRQLQHVKAKGSPVTFSNGADIHGHADHLGYDVAHHTIVLKGNAYMAQGGREFSGAEITYDMQTQRVQAKAGEGKRVRLVLPPSDTQKAETSQ